MLDPHVTELHAVAPFVIPAIMMAAQIGKGLLDQGRANRQSARADALNAAIPHADPGVQNQLNMIRMRQRYAETGQSRIADFKRQMALDANEQAQSNLLRGAGTSPGALQQGMLRSQDQTQRALMQAGAESEQVAPQYMQMQTPLISDIADRTLSLQAYLRDKTAFQAAQTQQNANNAFTGAMGLASSFDINKWTKNDAAAPVRVSQPVSDMPTGTDYRGLPPITAPDTYQGVEVQGIGNPGNNPWWQTNPLWATDR